MRGARILVLEDHPDTREAFAQLLEGCGYVVHAVATLAEALAALATDAYALVLADYVLDGRGDTERGMIELLDAARPMPVGCVSGWVTLPRSVLDRLAFTVSKPCEAEQLLAHVAAVASGGASPEVAAVVERYFAALSTKRWDVLAELCTDDVHYHLPGDDPELGRIVVGRAPFRAFAERTFERFPDASFDLLDVAALPRGAVARYRGAWRAATGELATLDGAVAFAFDRLQIAEIGVRLDVAKLRDVAPREA
jgi:CheY-like chemotaxis protein